MALPRLSTEEAENTSGSADREVDIEDWGRSIIVRGLTSQQINRSARRAEDPKRGGELNYDVRNGWYLVEGLIEPKINIKTAEHWLTECSYGPVSKILLAILEESGLTERSKEDAKSVLPEEPAASI